MSNKYLVMYMGILTIEGLHATVCFHRNYGCIYCYLHRLYWI